MKAVWAIAALLGLGGCQSEAESNLASAKDDLSYLKGSHATKVEICSAAKRVVDAHVRARSPSIEFQIASAQRDAECSSY